MVFNFFSKKYGDSRIAYGRLRSSLIRSCKRMCILRPKVLPATPGGSPPEPNKVDADGEQLVSASGPTLPGLAEEMDLGMAPIQAVDIASLNKLLPPGWQLQAGAGAGDDVGLADGKSPNSGSFVEDFADILLEDFGVDGHGDIFDQEDEDSEFLCTPVTAAPPVSTTAASSSAMPPLQGNESDVRKIVESLDENTHGATLQAELADLGWDEVLGDEDGEDVVLPTDNPGAARKGGGPPPGGPPGGGSLDAEILRDTKKEYFIGRAESEARRVIEAWSAMPGEGNPFKRTQWQSPDPATDSPGLCILRPTGATPCPDCGGRVSVSKGKKGHERTALSVRKVFNRSGVATYVAAQFFSCEAEDCGKERAGTCDAHLRTLLGPEGFTVVGRDILSPCLTSFLKTPSLPNVRALVVEGESHWRGVAADWKADQAPRGVLARSQAQKAYLQLCFDCCEKGRQSLLTVSPDEVTAVAYDSSWLNQSRKHGRILHTIMANTSAGPKILAVCWSQSASLQSINETWQQLAQRYPRIATIWADTGCGCSADKLQWSTAEKKFVIGPGGRSDKEYLQRFWPSVVVKLDLFHCLHRVKGALKQSSGLAGRVLQGMGRDFAYAKENAAGSVTIFRACLLDRWERRAKAYRRWGFTSGGAVFSSKAPLILARVFHHAQRGCLDPDLVGQQFARAQGTSMLEGWHSFLKNSIHRSVSILSQRVFSCFMGRLVHHFNNKRSRRGHVLSIGNPVVHDSFRKLVEKIPTEVLCPIGPAATSGAIIANTFGIFPPGDTLHETAPQKKKNFVSIAEMDKVRGTFVPPARGSPLLVAAALARWVCQFFKNRPISAHVVDNWYRNLCRDDDGSRKMPLLSPFEIEQALKREETKQREAEVLRRAGEGGLGLPGPTEGGAIGGSGAASLGGEAVGVGGGGEVNAEGGGAVVLSEGSPPDKKRRKKEKGTRCKGLSHYPNEELDLDGLCQSCRENCTEWKKKILNRIEREGGNAQGAFVLASTNKHAKELLRPYLDDLPPVGKRINEEAYKIFVNKYVVAADL